VFELVSCPAARIPTEICLLTEFGSGVFGVVFLDNNRLTGACLHIKQPHPTEASCPRSPVSFAKTTYACANIHSIKAAQRALFPASCVFADTASFERLVRSKLPDGGVHIEAAPLRCCAFALRVHTRVNNITLRDITFQDRNSLFTSSKDTGMSALS